jgi:hypothetical protein
MTNPDTNTTEACLYCIDGFTPAKSTLFGSCYRACPHCQFTCPCCDGEGEFPAWTRNLLELVATCNHVGFMPALCHGCMGLLGVVQIEEETPE